ncbi:MAG: nicotinate-nucleotide adenylyltransferase [Actinobacteria bacterium]|nr:nicotinate-nucleotide adenylyltransferase [Actinomycetota bacterium]
MDDTASRANDTSIGARVGLLGGTFDPPHLGHLVVAEEARIALGLDEVRFVVAGAPWMKRETSSPEHRVAMTVLAVRDRGGLTVDSREVEREGETYTMDTLEELHEEEPDAEWIFLVGADAAAKLDQWHRVDEVLEAASVVVVSRPGSAAALPETIEERVTRLDVTPIGITSTELRRRFGTGGATRFLVPDEVAAYVHAHGLYGAV